MSVSAPVSAVVVSHNPGALLPATLQGLKQAGDFAEVLLVDSGSTDGSVLQALREHPGVRCFPYDSNVGPCVTRNRGLREAQHEFVLLVDDDMELAPGLLAKLQSVLESDPDIAAVGPRICSGEHRTRVQYEGGRLHYAGIPSFTGAGSEEPPGPQREVDLLTSGCLLVRRTLLLRAGGFQPLLGYLMEDVELCLRLRLMGHRLVVVPEACTWNAGASAHLSLRGRRFPTRRLIQQARNRALMRRIVFTPGTRMLLWPGVVLFELAGLAMSTAALRPHAWFWGKWQALMLSSAALRAHKEFSRVRREGDAIVLGVPPFTFTSAAQTSGAGALSSRILAAVLRGWWAVVRRWIA